MLQFARHFLSLYPRTSQQWQVTSPMSKADSKDAVLSLRAILYHVLVKSKAFVFVINLGPIFRLLKNSKRFFFSHSNMKDKGLISIKKCLNMYMNTCKYYIRLYFNMNNKCGLYGIFSLMKYYVVLL